MKAEKFADEAYRRDPRIRYLGIVDNEFHILYSRMGEGVPSTTPGETDRNWVQLMAPIFVDSAERLQSFNGALESVTIRYAKVLLVFLRIEKLVVVLSYDPSVTTPFISSVSDWVRMLGSKYLAE